MQTAMVLTNPLELDIEWSTGVEPLDMHTMHPEPEEDKVSALAADMEQRGWHGAPIVAWGDRAWTGTHRIAAWNAIDGDLIPVVQLDDLLDAHGLNINDYDELTDISEEYAVAHMIADLPQHIRTAYGLDLEI